MKEAQIVWRRLRGARYAPPGKASADRRREVFVASIQQAEELIGASDGVGLSSRPITLFYALSQFGRALAAALGGANWELKGHGISAKHTNGPLCDIEIQDHKRGGSFVEVAAMLGSESLPRGAQFGELWPTLPESYGNSLPGQNERAVLVMDPLNLAGPHAGLISAQISARIGGLPDRLGGKPASAVDEFLAGYPSLSGYTFLRPDPVALSPDLGAVTGVSWTLPDSVGSDAARIEALAAKGYLYRGAKNRVCVPPIVGGNSSGIHCLVAWWAILHALSIVARYEPATWARLTDIDASPEAAALEFVLNDAIEAIPHIVLDVLIAQAGLAD